MSVTFPVAAILFLATWPGGYGCDDIVVYKVTVRFSWSEEKFPKDYPLYRPKAQWSPVLGQSHNSSYVLYRVGEVAKASVREFSQFGQLDDLVTEGEGQRGVYDQFSADAVSAVGETGNMVILDDEHTMVSLICRMIPSPDWFVGVDSLDLCVNAKWLDQITLDLSPLDAGAASGLTFTAPRWATIPPAPVTRHGPRAPDHPAAGFYYPELRELPMIAKIEFVKVKEYTAKELHDLTRRELLQSMLKKKNAKDIKRRVNNVDTEANRINIDEDSRSKESEEDEVISSIYNDISGNRVNIKDEVTSNNDVPKRKGNKEDKVKRRVNRVDVEVTTKSNIDKLMDLEEDPVGTPHPNVPDNNVVVVTKTPFFSTPEPEFGSELHNMDQVILAVARGRRLGQGRRLPRHFRSRLHHAVNTPQPSDCLVSDWSPWTPCSTTCGFGDKFRTRTVVRPKTGDGRDCPTLKERQHCGNVNSCAQIDYFEW